MNNEQLIQGLELSITAIRNQYDNCELIETNKESLKDIRKAFANLIEAIEAEMIISGATFERNHYVNKFLSEFPLDVVEEYNFKGIEGMQYAKCKTTILQRDVHTENSTMALIEHPEGQFNSELSKNVLFVNIQDHLEKI